MIDFELPAQLAPLVKLYMRPIVFSFIALQIVAGGVLVWLSQRRWGAKLTVINEKLAVVAYWKGLRITPRAPIDVIFLLMFTLLLAIYVWLIIDRAELCYPDQSHITAGGLQGKLWMQVQPWVGRFSPLLHQEFLLVSIFLKSAAGYYVLAAVLFVAVCLAMLGTLDLSSLAARLALVASLVVSESFAIPVSGLIFPEINVLLALMVFMGCASRYERQLADSRGKTSLLAAVGMIAVAAYLIYLKEPFFAVFGAYSLLAVGADVARWRSAAGLGGVSPIPWILARRAPQLAILGLSAVYAAVYFVYAYLQTVSRYGHDQSSGFAEVFSASLQSTPWIAVYGIVLVVRIVLIKRKASNYDPVVDPLAYAFVFYYAALLVLGLVHSYYYLPVAFMAVVLVAKTVAPFAGNKNLLAAVVVMSLCLMFLGLRPALGWFAHRDLYMQSRVLLVDALARMLQEQTPAGGADIYFLERVGGYERGEFLAYVNHRALGWSFVAAGQVPTEGGAGSSIAVLSLPVGALPEDGATLQEIQEAMDESVVGGKRPRILLAPPDQSGRNIRLAEESGGDIAGAAAQVVTIRAGFEPLKARLFSFFNVGGPKETAGYLVRFSAADPVPRGGESGSR